MRVVFQALLSEVTANRLGNSDLFKTSLGVQLNMTKTGYSVASIRQSRKYVHGDLQAIKNSTNLPLTLSYPSGDSGSYATKAEAVADINTNFATYYPDIA